MTQARPVIYGEVLFDQFPDGSRILGGAPFNVAWHLQAFGLSPLMISRIGNDAAGREIRNTMTTWGLDCAGLQLDSTHPTGTVEVGFTGSEPVYEIVPGRAYDFIDAKGLPPVTGVGLIYHGSLALRENTSRTSLEHLKNSLGVPAFVDINVRQPWWDPLLGNELIRGARWLKLNATELDLIMPGNMPLQDRMQRLIQDSSLEYLVITRSREGALAMTRSASTHKVSPRGTVTEVDAVGAGDAFSSVLLLAEFMSWPLHEALQRAQDFAESIVGIRGATIADREFYKPFIKQWGLE